MASGNCSWSFARQILGTQVSTMYNKQLCYLQISYKCRSMERRITIYIRSVGIRARY
jgi:hypothetical protein